MKPDDDKNQRAFNQWRLPADTCKQKFYKLLQEVRATVREQDEQDQNRFTLSRRGKGGVVQVKRMEDIGSFHAAVHSLVADLMYFSLGTWNGKTELIGIYIGRDEHALVTPERYKKGDVSACPVPEGANALSVSCFTKNLPYLLDKMEACGYLEQSKGGKFNFRPGKSGKEATGQRTLIRPGQALVELMTKHFPKGELSFRSFRPSPAEPIILLKGSKETGRELKDYEDTDTTRRLRADVELINKWYSLAPMRFDDSVLPEGIHRVDTRDRRIRRVFNNGETPEGREFKLGGRIGGGWWSSLPKVIRRQEGAVKLHNENVVELDFSCFNPRVLYALNKIEAPQGDLYEVGLPSECRAAVKIVFNSMVFYHKKLSAWPSNLDPKVIEPCTVAGVGISDPSRDPQDSPAHCSPLQQSGEDRIQVAQHREQHCDPCASRVGKEGNCSPVFSRLCDGASGQNTDRTQCNGRGVQERDRCSASDQENALRPA